MPAREQLDEQQAPPGAETGEITVPAAVRGRETVDQDQRSTPPQSSLVDAHGQMIGETTCGATAVPVGWRQRTCTPRRGMCLTCGCMDAHLDMGEINIRYEDVKAAADENGRTVAETLEIMDQTVAKDREEHADEYSAT
jgi:hypothetical protein